MQLQFRRDTAAAWNLADPILADGEVGFCRDLNFIKIGDGVRHWSALEVHAPNTDGAIAAAADARAVANAAAQSAAAVASALAALPAPGGGGGVVWGAPIVFNPAVAGLQSVAHGLAGVPDGSTRRLICLAADLGYAVGDVVEFTGTAQYLTVSYSIINMIAGLTNITGSAGGFLVHKTAGYADTLTGAKWMLEVTPYKFL